MEQLGFTKHCNYVMLVIYIVMLSTFTLPMAIFAGHQLHKHWNAEFIVKRRRKLILSLYILWCFHSFVEFPTLTIRIDTQSFFEFLPFVIMDDIFLLTRCLSIAIFSMRLYLMYYDHEYTRTLGGDGWRILIDPSLEKTNWFLANRRHRYGNSAFLFKRLILILLLYSIPYFIVVYSIPKAKFTAIFTMQTLWSMCAVGFAVYYWKKYPKSVDSWCIRHEIALICKIYLFAIVLLVLVCICYSFVGMDPYFLLAMVCIDVELVMGGLFYGLVIYPVRQFTSGTRIQTKADGFQQDLKDILRTKEGYEAFADYLQSEWSVENLLFVTEYIQLKTVILQKETFKDTVEATDALAFELELPEHMATSIIVAPLAEMIHNEQVPPTCYFINNEQVENALLKTTQKMYEKYLDPSATLEVIISSGIRESLMTVFEENNDTSSYTLGTVMEKILIPIEAAVVEVMDLMEVTYMRFKETDAFNELVKQHEWEKKHEKSSI
eukprot:38286_1